MEMSNLFRIITTVAGFICFLAIALWAYGRPARAGFEEAAMQPIADNDTPAMDLGEKQ
ncbi:cbb3-type cytochrome oxidase subunit 3 [Chitinimonas sp.]|uniref:cbb3-type cytochrome oxidase subunit 3 n=1 Tax=Chitinimonas sp. TaxID=1934313 RepID=UPI0035B3D3DB